MNSSFWHQGKVGDAVVLYRDNTLFCTVSGLEQGVMAKEEMKVLLDSLNHAVDAPREADYWKRVAGYLASCHAATYEYDGKLKSTSAVRRARLKNICVKAKEMLEGRWANWNEPGTGFDFVLKRLNGCLSEKADSNEKL